MIYFVTAALIATWAMFLYKKLWPQKYLSEFVAPKEWVDELIEKRTFYFLDGEKNPKKFSPEEIGKIKNIVGTKCKAEVNHYGVIEKIIDNRGNKHLLFNYGEASVGLDSCNNFVILGGDIEKARELAEEEFRVEARKGW